MHKNDKMIQRTIRRNKLHDEWLDVIAEALEVPKTEVARLTELMGIIHIIERLGLGEGIKEIKEFTDREKKMAKKHLLNEMDACTSWGMRQIYGGDDQEFFTRRTEEFRPLLLKE